MGEKKKEESSNLEEVEASVGNVVTTGKSPYFVAYPRSTAGLPAGSENLAITCSLNNYDDDDPPVKGQVVILSNVREYARGWRAGQARPKRLKR